MRFLRFSQTGKLGLAVADGDRFYGFLDGDDGYPGDLDKLVAAGGGGLKSAASVLRAGREIDLNAVAYLPPFTGAGSKIICLGINYVDHAAETGYEPPSFPTIFARFADTLIGHGAPLVVPRVSDQYDYEGELVAVIGKTGKHISREAALDYVAGYSIFNDGSVRDWQKQTPQWTVGKNFDNSGAFGPYFVTADEVPAGGAGLAIQTRLNGRVVQNASTADMVFSVIDTVTLLSKAMTLRAGDILVMGTPPGVGMARKPPLYMKQGDVCEVEIEGLGILRNPVTAEAA
ncbi:fumarylacetoacetate hydrolase family protein [Trinickia mobilis]|uniref:fumarylacetoacetate hydrolase family protein n=1 Tax=Trinickia mobilis TaxID=2816356 RepID=UPI001A8D3DD2|nr:fumarylacetoacetate hydrolase family protein [Trinickia mobilis]